MASLSKSIIIFKLDELQRELNEYLKYAAESNITVSISSTYMIPIGKTTELTQIVIDACDKENSLYNSIMQGY